MVAIRHYYYILSTWSLVAEKALAEVLAYFGDSVQYDWRIANHDYGQHGQFTLAQLEGFYGRLEAATGKRMSTGWWSEGYDWTVPDRVVVAAKLLGADGSDVRLAVARAGLQNGVPITDPQTALAIANQVSGLDLSLLERTFDSPSTLYALDQMSQEFKALGVPLRPAFQLRNDIEDTVVLSGIWQARPMIAAIESLLEDERAYQKYYALQSSGGGELL